MFLIKKKIKSYTCYICSIKLVRNFVVEILVNSQPCCVCVCVEENGRATVDVATSNNNKRSESGRKKTCNVNTYYI